MRTRFFLDNLISCELLQKSVLQQEILTPGTAKSQNALYVHVRPISVLFEVLDTFFFVNFS